jgi:hypothetical protein
VLPEELGELVELEPVAPSVLPLDVAPEALEPVSELVLEPVLAPYWRRHWSRSRPVLPRHWLGVVEDVPPAAAPVSLLVPVLVPPLVLDPVLPPTLEPLLELGEVVDPLVVELGELIEPLPMLEPLEPMLPEPVAPDVPPALLPPALPPAPPPDCAHDAPATATNAAATATAIAFTISSPWSVEEGLQPPGLQEQCRDGCSVDSTGARAARGHCPHDAGKTHTVCPESHSCPNPHRRGRASPACPTARITC